MKDRALTALTALLGLFFVLVFLVPVLSEFRAPWMLDLWHWVFGTG